MTNVDRVVEVLFIIKQKSMKKCCQVIKTKLLFLIQFISYSFFIIILHVVYITKISVLPTLLFS